MVYVTLKDYTAALNLYYVLHHYDSVEQLKEYEGEVEYVELTVEELETINSRNFLDNINLN